MERLEKDNKFYNTFREALGGENAFFYDRNGEETFKELGIERDPFYNYQETGDKEVDEAEFLRLYKKAVDYSSSSTQASSSSESEVCDEENNCDDSTGITNLGSSSVKSSKQEAVTSAKDYISSVARNAKSTSREEATAQAASLLNAAVSANEPYSAARSAGTILAGIEQVHLEEEGPINEIANYLENEQETIDENGELISLGKAGDSTNLLAAISGNPYSTEAASIYSRDRIVREVDNVNERNIKETTIAVKSSWKNFFSWVGSLFGGQNSADEDILEKLTTSTIAEALFMNPSETIKGEALGERLVEGVSFINSSLAKNTGASNGSSDEAVAVYNLYTKSLLDRKIAAQRSEKNPFDLSSPYSFLGSIVSKIYSKSLFSLLKTPIVSANNLSGTYLGTETTSEYCKTVGAIDAKGDLYCNQITTYDTLDYEKTYNGSTVNLLTAPIEYYENLDILKNNFENSDVKNGEIKDESLLAEFIILGAGRESTPGLKDANVCETKKTGVSIKKLLSKFFSGDVSEACQGEDEKVATGERYSNTAGNSVNWNEVYRYFQGYYMETYAMEFLGYYDAKDEKSPIVAYKEKYYEVNPKDNSLEGVIARRTGWRKDDVIAGLESLYLIAYLNEYSPETRLAFFKLPQPTKVYLEVSPFPEKILALRTERETIKQRKEITITA